MTRLFLHIFILLALSVSGVAAQSLSDLNNRRKKAEEEITYIDKLLKKTSTDQKNNLQRLELTKKKIASRKQIVADMDAQIHILETDVNKKQGDVAGLQNNLDTLKKSYEQLLYQAYKNRDQRLWLMFILSSEDIGLAYRRWQYFKNYSEYINDQAIKIQQTSTRLSEEIVSLNTKKETLAIHKKSREKEVKTLQSEEAGAQEMAQNLVSQEKELAKKMNTQRKAVEKINKEIERIVAEQVKKDQESRKKAAAKKPTSTDPKSKEVEKTYTDLPTADKALSDRFENNKGRLPWPVRKGVITGKFGVHFDPVFKNIKLMPNNGIDISTEDNSTALCVFDGIVRRIFPIPGMNNCVMVQHGDYYTLYCKLANVNVQVGDKVSTGQTIGTIFTTGNTVLHFEMWHGTKKLDPEIWLKK